LNIRLIVVGKINNSPYKAISDHYINNIGLLIKKAFNGNFDLIEISKSPDRNIQIRKNKEAKEILKKINKKNSVNFLLDEKGLLISTDILKNHIEKSFLEAKNEINFIIGGPDGISEDFKIGIYKSLSISKMTLSHLLARVIMLEQLYRSLSIMANHPYHRE
tara:strand:- start:940 stop:1425 length:486 start_codon:yes stop_codon:yes gene_type:complete